MPFPEIWCSLIHPCSCCCHLTILQDCSVRQYLRSCHTGSLRYCPCLPRGNSHISLALRNMSQDKLYIRFYSAALGGLKFLSCELGTNTPWLQRQILQVFPYAFLSPSLRWREKDSIFPPKGGSRYLFGNTLPINSLQCILPPKPLTAFHILSGWGCGTHHSSSWLSPF